jgi:Amt family ammonium transporter
MAMLVTQIATAGAALAWMGTEWALHGKPSALGIVSGAVAGLVAITPASGTAGPAGALLIGISAGVLCFLAAARLKRAISYDDSQRLQHYAVKVIGAALGVCAGSLGGASLAERHDRSAALEQAGRPVRLAFSGIATFIILKLLDVTVACVSASRRSEDSISP